MTAEYHAPCTVCGRSDPDGREYGRRPYCVEHLNAFVADVPAVWQASTLAFGTLLLLIIATGIASAILPPTQTISAAVAVVLITLPGLVWLTALYRFSRQTGADVTPLLPTVMLIGALIAAAAIRPLLHNLLEIPQWLSLTTQSNRLLGNLLINGFINSFVIYSIVRFTVWRTPVFVHRVDGVVFAVGVGWGYTTMLASLYLLDQGGITVLNGSLRALSMLCANLAPAYILGFFLGRNRFEDMPFFYLTSGLAMAAGINGLLLFATVELNNVALGVTQDAYDAWPGMILAAVLLIATYATIFGLMRRHNGLTRARLERHE